MLRRLSCLMSTHLRRSIGPLTTRSISTRSSSGMAFHRSWVANRGKTWTGWLTPFTTCSIRSSLKTTCWSNSPRLVPCSSRSPSRMPNSRGSHRRSYPRLAGNCRRWTACWPISGESLLLREKLPSNLPSTNHWPENCSSRGQTGAWAGKSYSTNRYSIPGAMSGTAWSSGQSSRPITCAWHGEGRIALSRKGKSSNFCGLSSRLSAYWRIPAQFKCIEL